MISMGHPKKQKIRTQVATGFECSAVDPDGETLTSMIKEEEQRHQQILQGLADVDKAKVVSHADLVYFSNRLKNYN